MQRSEIEAFLARHDLLVGDAAHRPRSMRSRVCSRVPRPDASKGEPRLNRSTATGSTPFPT